MEKHILFVCTANLNRSKTAKDLFKNTYNIKSAGILAEDTESTNPITQNLIDWADLVIVFEKEHIHFLKHLFPDLNKPIVNLEVPDIYHYYNPELLEILKKRVTHVIKKIHKLEGIHDYSKLVD